MPSVIGALVYLASYPVGALLLLLGVARFFIAPSGLGTLGGVSLALAGAVALPPTRHALEFLAARRLEDGDARSLFVAGLVAATLLNTAAR